MTVSERLPVGAKVIYMVGNPGPEGYTIPAPDYGGMNGKIWTVSSRYEPNTYKNGSEAHYFINENGYLVGPYYSGLCDLLVELYGEDEEDCV